MLLFVGMSSKTPFFGEEEKSSVNIILLFPYIQQIVVPKF